MSLISKSNFLRWTLYLLFMICGCSTTLTTKVLVPAKAHEKAQFSRIAILPFSGDQGEQTRKEIESIMDSLQVQGKPFFKVIDRDKIDRVALKHNFRIDDNIDEAAAASFGKILDSEVVILGTISKFISTGTGAKRKR